MNRFRWNYRKVSRDASERSAALFDGEFATTEDRIVDVFYEKVLFFMEHSLINPTTNNLDNRILVAAQWASRGLKIGAQHQILAKGDRSSSSVFPTCTVENVKFIGRNISAIETWKKRPGWEGKGPILLTPTWNYTIFWDLDMTIRVAKCNMSFVELRCSV